MVKWLMWGIALCSLSDLRADPILFTLIRHGECVANAEDKVCGSVKGGASPLTKRGKIQAGMLKDYFPEGARPFDFILCSPMVRAQQTAAPLGEALGLKIIVDDGLRERDLGELDLCDAQLVRRRKKLERAHPIAWETYPAHTERVMAFLKEAHDKYPDQEHLLMVGHGGTIRRIREKCRNIKQFRGPASADNGSAATFRYWGKTGEVELVEFRHLPAM